jgi:Gram-negative bacterial TonB protein C-terminal
MNRLSPAVLLTCGLLLACGSPRPTLQWRANSRAPVMPLCDLLEHVRNGDKVAATVSGILAVQFELELLYDPSQPLCSLDVAPNTWVEFDKAVRIDDRLERLLRRDYQAYVTLRGVLWGPGAVGPDDPTIPAWVAYARRTGNRRYGHLHGWRTKFVVSEVLDWRPVTDKVPPSKPRPVSSIPTVIAAAVPSYPRWALAGSITGTVVVDVTVKKGNVTETKVVSGDRLLAPAVVENIQTWRFRDDVDATFSTTFSFALELRETGADRNPRIELHLPLSMKIIGPSDGW